MRRTRCYRGGIWMSTAPQHKEMVRHPLHYSRIQSGSMASALNRIFLHIFFLLKLHDDPTKGGTFSLLLFIFSIFRIRWCTVQITHYLFYRSSHSRPRYTFSRQRQSNIGEKMKKGEPMKCVLYIHSRVERRGNTRIACQNLFNLFLFRHWISCLYIILLGTEKKRRKLSCWHCRKAI